LCLPISLNTSTSELSVIVTEGIVIEGAVDVVEEVSLIVG
jgi:hypothetical protein